MKIVFQADASPGGGAGHVMRLLPLVEEFVSRGLNVVFLTKAVQVPWVLQRLQKLGSNLRLISDDSYISDSAEDVLIVDSYRMNPLDKFYGVSSWLLRVSIGDENTPDYRFQVTVKPSFENSVIKKTDCGILASGKDFFLFRNSVNSWRQSLDSGAHMGQKILIVGGGTDPTGFGSSLIRHLEKNFTGLDLVLFTNDQNIRAEANSLTLIDFGEKLDLIIPTCCAAFCPASTISLEFAAAGVPIGVGLAVPNQKGGYKALSELGLGSAIGSYNMNDGWKFLDEWVSKLLLDSTFRRELSNQAKNFFDLAGATRTADLILEQAHFSAQIGK